MPLESSNTIIDSDFKRKKLVVLWLCYFSNSEIQDRLKPFKRIGDIAPWITNMIPLFENDDSIELHIVSQHKWIPWYKNVKKKGINYHFLNIGIPFLGRQWPGFFRFDYLIKNYFWNRKIDSIVRKVKPDIIHLHGVENEFCTAITQFNLKFPVLITIQGFIHKTSIKSRSAERRIRKELEIIKMFRHFGYRTETMGNDIKLLNPEAILHWHCYPLKPINPIKAEKKYDLVFFARITEDKGIGDLLEAISVIKKRKTDISLCVIGAGNSQPFKELAKKLDIKDNIYWAGFLPKQSDVHMMASTARVSVLPTYHDIISGTIMESLFLELPVVAYNVGSIHEINKKKEIIYLVEKGNIAGLANAIMVLLNNEDLRNEKALLGSHVAKEIFTSDNKSIYNDLQKAYINVIEDFHNTLKENFSLKNTL